MRPHYSPADNGTYQPSRQQLAWMQFQADCDALKADVAAGRIPAREGRPRFDALLAAYRAEKDRLAFASFLNNRGLGFIAERV